MRFSFCTLVSDFDLYQKFRDSAANAGFEDDCEFLTTDNTGTSQTDAYAGLNSMLDQAKGEIVILCHQDILLEFDNRAELENKLASLPEDWAVCGIAGISELGAPTVRISDKHGENQKNGSFPAHVTSLDECFLVVRKQSGTRLSNNISGFHLYGTDICLIAEMLGWRAFVIDFHIRHLGEGSIRQDYFDAAAAFEKKWSYQLRDRYLRTTAKSMYLSGRRQSWVVQKIKSGLMRHRQNRHSRPL